MSSQLSETMIGGYIVGHNQTPVTVVRDKRAVQPRLLLVLRTDRGSPALRVSVFFTQLVQGLARNAAPDVAQLWARRVMLQPS
jgi:hypothetical protein